MNSALCTDLQVQPSCSRVRHNLTKNDNVSCTSNPLREISLQQWLKGGLMFLVVLFFSLTVILLSLYLQVNSRLRRGQEEAETLRLNSSRWLDELETVREYGFSLQTNLSSLLQEYLSLQGVLLPQLLYNETQQQKDLKIIERHRLDLHSNFSVLQEEYKHLRERNVLIPRTSSLLKDCLSTDPILCPLCPSSWTTFELSCYLQSEDTQSWEESLSWCRIQGGFLAVVNDENEQNFLEDTVKETTWIGLSDHLREGYWRWVDGTPYDSTTRFWGRDQPDNDGNEDCVTLSPVSKWNDEMCDKKLKGVCERRAGQLTMQGDTLSN